MSLTTVVSGVAGLAALATALSIVTVVYLVNDINNFYDDAIGELSDFKVEMPLKHTSEYPLENLE